jgi:rod shape-determining protein MreD
MRWITFAILLVALMIVQASFVQPLALAQGRAQLNVLLILLTYVALYAEPHDLVTASFLTGLGADIVGVTMGPYTIAFGLAGALLGEFRRFLIVNKWRYQTIAIVGAGIFTGVLANILLSVKGHGPAAWGWSTLATGLLGPLLFIPLHWLLRPHPSRRPLRVT